MDSEGAIHQEESSDTDNRTWGFSSLNKKASFFNSRISFGRNCTEICLEYWKAAKFYRQLVIYSLQETGRRSIRRMFRNRMDFQYFCGIRGTCNYTRNRYTNLLVSRQSSWIRRSPSRDWCIFTDIFAIHPKGLHIKDSCRMILTP